MNDIAVRCNVIFLASTVDCRQNIYTVAKKTAPLLPSSELLLRRLGERLRLARLRRRLTAKQVAERAGMAPMTLRSAERGGSGVTIGAYLAIMQVLGVEQDLDLLAQQDRLGRELQDARLPARHARSVRPLPASSGTAKRQRPPVAVSRAWSELSDFASSTALAELIDPGVGSAKKRR